ncbi:MAG: SGNH/GDSL hydrolase family protein [Cyanobacteria bacterium P01_F01_bin.150]
MTDAQNSESTGGRNLSGALYVADQTLDTLLLVQDLNGDGDANDPSEATVYFDGTNASGLLEPTGNIFTVLQAADGSVLYGDGDSDTVYRLTDTNRDGDALDADEATVWFSSDNAEGLPLLTPNGLATGPDGAVYITEADTVATPNGDFIYRTEDLNGDGDANDADEARVWLDLKALNPNSSAFEITFIGDVAYIIDSAGGDPNVLYRAEDANGDGTIDTSEASVLVDETIVPVDFGLASDSQSLYVVELLDFSEAQSVFRIDDNNGSATVTEVWNNTAVPDGYLSSVAFSIAASDNGMLAITSNGVDPNEDNIFQLTDLNGDGDYFDEGETVPFLSRLDTDTVPERPRVVEYAANPTPIVPGIVLTATDAYYTFSGSISSNSTRLLGDKATAIGLEGLDTISFLQFDPMALPETLLDQAFSATLTLEHDASLADSLIPATDDRPVILSIYDLDAPFDDTKPGGNLADIDYGENGANAIAVTSVGDDGLYSWDVTELIAEWAVDTTQNDGLAISGIFGNENLDDRNSYGIFHTVGSTDGLVPTLTITPKEDDLQVSLSTSTTFEGDLNALVENQGTAITFRFDLSGPALAGGLTLFVDADVEQMLNRLDLPTFAFNPITENIDFRSVIPNRDSSGFVLTIDEGATFGTATLNIFDNNEPEPTLPETFDGRVDATFSLVTEDQVDRDIEGPIPTLSDYTIDPAAATSVVIFADDISQLEDPTDPQPPTPGDGLQVSLFTGPNYLIEDEGTVSAHAFNVTGGVIPEGGLVVAVDAPNLNEFDLAAISVEGGSIEAVRDGGFDLRMTEYTTLVNLPIANDGEIEIGETASFSLAAGDGYNIVADYSGGSFGLVDTRLDIPMGVINEPNNAIAFATETQISPENPTFLGTDSIYFDIGNRYLNDDGTYTYIDYSEDVDVFKVDLTAGQTITIETFDFDTNVDEFGVGFAINAFVYDAEGNQLQDYINTGFDPAAAPDKLFGGLGPFDVNETDSYDEFTAPADGSYFIAVGDDGQVQNFWDVVAPFYDPNVPGSGNGNRSIFGDYSIEINLITDDNPRKVGTPTPPVSNPGVTNPPTLSLSANPTTTNGDGNFINAVVEHVDVGGVSSVTFTIQAEGEIPDGGIEFVLNSDANLFDYVSYLGQSALPSTIGGQSLGAYYNADGIPTGIRLLIDEPLMTVTYESANNQPWFPTFYGNIVDRYEPLETDGAEDVTFFLQPGEGYTIDADAGSTEVTYYDSVADVPPPTTPGGTVPEVGITVSETTLIETEQTETTLTFSLSEAPPAEGLTIFVDSDDEPVVGSPLSQFAVLEAEVSGGNFPIPNADSSGFFFTVTEQTASITLAVFDELTVPNIDPLTVQEGIVALNFALQPLAGYTIDPDASDVGLTIADNPDSGIQVSLTGSPDTLIESEGTAGVHTFSLSTPPSAEGLTVSVSASALDEFDLDAIAVEGGSIAAVSTDGFDLTITEQTATISLPVLNDGVDEGSETASFALEASDDYELNAAFNEATFTLADTLDQATVSVESELIGDEISNSTIPEANALSVSSSNPTVSINGLIGESFSDLPEDVDFFSFDLDAGQTISLDIDTEEILPNTINFRQVVYPALANILQKPDTELRLFDAQGNELASNNDGAAEDEDFSRDPFLEYTATSAGTYYVGVSQLGNRNYDPFVSRSGSGWTFPEIGVNNGFYELTATLEDSDLEPGPFENLVIFGDSLSDAGNAFQISDGAVPPSPPYVNGRFSNGDLIVDFIAEALGLPENESYLLGGSNYAFGGAQTGEGTSFTGTLEGLLNPVEVPNIAQQIDLYLADQTPANTDLFFIYGGGNDFIAPLAAGQGIPTPESVVGNITAHITELAEAGATTFVVPNLPSPGISPLFAGQPPEVRGLLNNATDAFNQLLDVELDAIASDLDVTILEPDFNGIVDDILANPSQFGLTNVTDSVIDFSSGTLIGNPDEFFFWDFVHSTTAANDIIADEAIELLLDNPDPGPPAGFTVFDFEWTGQIAGFSVEGTFSYDATQTFTDDIVREEDLLGFDISFFDPDGNLLRTYENNHLTFSEFNFAFDINNQQILTDGIFTEPDGLNVGEKTAVGDGFTGLNLWSKSKETSSSLIHVDDWSDEFGFPLGYSSHEDIAFLTLTTAELIETGKVGETYLDDIQDTLTELGQPIRVVPDGGLEADSLDFESNFQGELSAGDVITDQFDDLTIEVAGDLTAMIFDSANPTGGDYDLRSDTLGNVLIISEDGDSADPDDNAKGGTLMFDWDGTVSVESLGLLDIEESGGMVTLYGADDNAVLATIDIPGLGDNSLQSLDIGIADIGKMDVFLAGSGAITEIILAEDSIA